ncbi:unnamed protein product [Durusdinium trenchii]|uniref:Uncharacterized protein n=1 Tax=Durusdinium trenchii TaxID=1381693 RepID=A0ABP0SQ66_9DINO
MRCLLLWVLPAVAWSNCCSNPCLQCDRRTNCAEAGGQWLCETESEPQRGAPRLPANARQEHLAQLKRRSADEQARRIDRLVALLKGDEVIAPKRGEESLSG